jgi:hypothetical protein
MFLCICHAFDSYPNGVAALFGPDSIPTAGLVQMVAAVGVLECAFMRDSPEPETSSLMTSVTDTSTLDGTPSPTRSSSKSVLWSY